MTRSLKRAQAPKKAKEASRAVADFQDAVHALRTDFQALRADFQALRVDFAEVKGLTTRQSWMLATNLVLIVGVLFRLLTK